MTVQSPNVVLIDKHLAAYNAQDLDAMMACYTDDCVQTAPDRSVTEKSIDEIRARYSKAFTAFPQNKAKLLNRIAVGATVADHEHVARAPNGEEFEIIAIYTIRDGLIARVDFAK